MSSPAEGLDYFKGLPCGVDNCPSRWFYKDNGKIYCKGSNHEQQEVTETQTEETGAPGSQGLTTRARREAAEKVSTTLSGTEAFHLYLTCYQQLLRHQCYALIDSKGFPRELEQIVKDLWALRLPLIQEKLASTLTGDDASDLQQDRNDESKLYSSQTEWDEDSNKIGSIGDKLIKRDHMSLGDLPRSSYEEKSDGGIKRYSSQTESDDDDDDPSGVNGTKDRSTERNSPLLVDSLGLCYMGMMILRQPISLGDLFRWASSEDIPFLRPLRLIPAEARQKLPTKYITALESKSPLEADNLYVSVLNLTKLYYRHFGLELPDLNYEPLIFQHIKALALPIDLFPAVKVIASLFPSPFSFPRLKSHYHLSFLPELQLLSFLIIVVKIYHPFDGIERYVHPDTDLGHLAIDWTIWRSAYAAYAKTTQENRPFPPGGEIRVQVKDVYDMSTSQLDSYLSWYEQYLTSDQLPKSHPRSRVPQELLSIFPATTDSPSQPLFQKEDTDPLFSSASATFLATVQSGLKSRGVLSNAKKDIKTKPVRRLGDVQLFRMEDELEGNAKAFYDKVAEAGGLGLETLVKGVFRVERKLFEEGKDRESDENG